MLRWTRAGESLLCSKISGQWLCPNFWGADSGSLAGQLCHHTQLVGAGQEHSLPLPSPFPAQESPLQVGSLEGNHKLCLCSELVLHKCMVHALGCPAQWRDGTGSRKDDKTLERGWSKTANTPGPLAQQKGLKICIDRILSSTSWEDQNLLHSAPHLNHSKRKVQMVPLLHLLCCYRYLSCCTPIPLRHSIKAGTS